MILKALLIAVASASVSFLISRMPIFERMRFWIQKKSSFFGELMSCCYCLGHWVSAGLMILMPVTLFGIFRPLDYLLTWLVISWIAGILSMVTGRLWNE